MRDFSSRRLLSRSGASLRMERDGKMCVVGLRYFVARASTTLLIRLRFNVILLCEAYFRCREQIKKTGSRCW